MIFMVSSASPVTGTRARQATPSAAWRTNAEPCEPHPDRSGTCARAWRPGTRERLAALARPRRTNFLRWASVL